jgi:hypothetical protein
MGPGATRDPAAARVTLLTRPGCQLCGPARQVVAAACAEAGRSYLEVNVDTEAELRAEFGDRVPVVLLDGVEFAALAIDHAPLLAAVRGLGQGAP